MKGIIGLLHEEIRLHQNELIPVVDYFDATYVKGPPPRNAPGRERDRGRGQGAVSRSLSRRYPLDTWNHYKTTLDNGNRTNNVSKG